MITFFTLFRGKYKWSKRHNLFKQTVKYHKVIHFLCCKGFPSENINPCYNVNQLFALYLLNMSLCWNKCLSNLMSESKREHVRKKGGFDPRLIWCKSCIAMWRLQSYASGASENHARVDKILFINCVNVAGTCTLCEQTLFF